MKIYFISFDVLSYMHHSKNIILIKIGSILVKYLLVLLDIFYYLFNYFFMKNNFFMLKNYFFKLDPIGQFEVFFFVLFIHQRALSDALLQIYLGHRTVMEIIQIYMVYVIPRSVHNFASLYWCFLPELFIFLSIIFLILHKNIKFIAFMRYNLTGLGLIFGYWFVLFCINRAPLIHFYFANYYFFDWYIFSIKLLFFAIFLLFFTIIFYRFFYKKQIEEVDLEFYRIVYILFLSFWLLSFLLISSNNLFGFYFILEGLSFIIIFSCVLNFNKAFCLLTSIRYFTLNSFASGCFLFGIIVLQIFYQTADLFYLKNLIPFTGSYRHLGSNPFINYTNSPDHEPEDYYAHLIFGEGWIHHAALVFFVFFVTGCFFKLGCFPFNWWLLSINCFISYETFFLFNVIFKNLFFFLFFRIITYYFSGLALFWIPLFLFIGISTVGIGTFGMFSQKQIKGFFTFSSVTQIGYTLIGISLTTVEGYTSVFFLHFVYLLNSVIVFSILFYLSSDVKAQSTTMKSRNVFFALSDLNILRFINPLTAIAFTVAILSFAGLPPTFGFFSKYYYFEVLIKTGLYKLCIVLLLLNTLNLYPYISILKNLWFVNNNDTFNAAFLPVFNKEYFMVGSMKYYIFLNFCAVYLYGIILELCQKISFYGSRVIFAQWYDQLGSMGTNIQWRYYQMHKYYDGRVAKCTISNLKQGDASNNDTTPRFDRPQNLWEHRFSYIYDYERYGPGVNNSTLKDIKHDEDLYLRWFQLLNPKELRGKRKIECFSDNLDFIYSYEDQILLTYGNILCLLLLLYSFYAIYSEHGRYIESRNVNLSVVPIHGVGGYYFDGQNVTFVFAPTWYYFGKFYYEPKFLKEFNPDDLTWLYFGKYYDMQRDFVAQYKYEDITWLYFGKYYDVQRNFVKQYKYEDITWLYFGKYYDMQKNFLKKLKKKW